MKNSATFEEQIEKIADVLLSDLTGKKSKIVYHGLYYERSDQLVLHGLQVSRPTFDPIAVAHYLRELGDRFNEDLEEPARNIIAEADDKKVEKFGEMVESLSRTWQNYYELQYETAFLAASVKLFVFLAKKARNIAHSSLLTQAISGNPEVRQYVEHQGGWENFGNQRR